MFIRRSSVLGGTVALLTSLAPSTARADVLPPGSKSLRHDVVIELSQQIRAQSYWETVVGEGETLSEIAERTLGSADRWPELAERNGLENADRLVVGQVLVIPPAVEQESVYHLYYFYAYPFHHEPARVRVGALLPYFKTDLCVCAVREGDVEEFLELAKFDFKRRDTLDAHTIDLPVPPFALSSRVEVARSISRLSPVAAKTTVLTLEEIDGAKLRIGRETRNGTLEEGDEPMKRAGAFVLIPAISVAVLWDLRRRRRRAVPTPTSARA